MKPLTKPLARTLLWVILGYAALCLVLVLLMLGSYLGFFGMDEAGIKNYPGAGLQSFLWGALPFAVVLSLGLFVACSVIDPLFMANVLAGISMYVGKAASWLIMPLIFMIMFDVITRKIDYIKEKSADITIEYGYSVSFILQDLQWHIHGMLLLLTFGFGYLLNAHVRVDIFRENLSRRSQVRTEMIGLLLCATPFLLLSVYFSWNLTYGSWTQGEGSESQVGIGMRWIIKSFLIWGFIIAYMAALATLYRCLCYLYGDYDQQAEAEEKLQFFTDAHILPTLIIDQNDGMGTEGSK